jgi:hypothetical protein
MFGGAHAVDLASRTMSVAQRAKIDGELPSERPNEVRAIRVIADFDLLD